MTATSATEFPPIVGLRNDIPYSVAEAAHKGTSWTPEKRAVQVQEGYAEEMREQYEKLRKMARNETEQRIVDDFFPRFRSAMRRLYIDYYQSRSRIVSSFIAGPSKFPGRQMEKRNRWADNKLEHLQSVRSRMLKRVYRDLRPEKRPVMSGDSDAVTRLKEKIKIKENKHQLCLLVNKAHKAYLKEPSTLDEFDLPETQKNIIRNYKPQYSWEPHPIPPYWFQNSSSELRRLKQRLEQIEVNKVIPVQETVVDGIRFEDNPSENRVRLFFPGKPDAETRRKLKGSGFRWAPSIGAWQAYRNPRTIETAKSFVEQTEQHEQEQKTNS